MSEDNVQRRINRSQTYLLPLPNNYITLTNIIIKNLHNTYIYCENQSNFNYFYLTFLIDNFSNEVFIHIKDHLEQSTIYQETIIDNNILIFKFKFPEEHIEDYKLLLEGQFSKIKESSKQKIILFIKNNFPSDYNTSTMVQHILFKSKKLKQTLEQNLDLKLNNNLELSSKFNLNEETYKFSKLINNE